MPDEVHMMRKEIYDSEGYTQRTSMPVWQARCAAQQPTRREHGLRANPVLRARTVALPFLFVLCVTDVWPSSSTRRGVCKSASGRRGGPAFTNEAEERSFRYANIVKVTLNYQLCGPHMMLSVVPTPRDLAVLAPPYARIRYTELCGIPRPPRPRLPRLPAPVPGIRGTYCTIRAGGSSCQRVRGSCSARTLLAPLAARHDWRTRVWGWRARGARWRAVIVIGARCASAARPRRRLVDSFRD